MLLIKLNRPSAPRLGVGGSEIVEKTFREKLDYAREYTGGLLKKIGGCRDALS